jgi:hypothetical protein
LNEKITLDHFLTTGGTNVAEGEFEWEMWGLVVVVVVVVEIILKRKKVWAKKIRFESKIWKKAIWK